MFEQTSFRWAWLPLAMMALALSGSPTWGAEPSGEAARLDCYAHPNGEHYFALCLRPGGSLPAAGAHDILVLFDTSASQAGAYRAEARSVLQGLLSSLAAGDRVALTAVDLNAIPLSPSFVAPQSPEMAAALAKLSARIPLGTTDMERALAAAGKAFAADPKRAREVVYIGKGTSLLNLLALEKLEELIKTLVDGRISFTSYAIGPRVDRQLLGVLAAQTGGLVIGQSDSADQDARKLAAAVRGTVWWPTAVAWPAAMPHIYPKNAPPLRSDRESVVIGRCKGEEPMVVQMTAESVSGPQKFSWTVRPGKPDKRNSHLVPLVERARVDGGLSLPLVDCASLAAARDEVTIGVVNLSELAHQALASGNLDNAEQLAQGALRRNPSDKEAQAILAEVAKQRQGGAPPAEGGAGDLTLFGAGQMPPAGAMAESFDRDRKLIAKVIETDVTSAVNQARKQMATDPEGATQNLKLKLQDVRQTAELNPDLRDQLVDMIQAALREANRRTVAEEQRRQQRLEVEAAAHARMLVNESLQGKQQKLKQLMARFDSLMDEGLYKQAEEEVAAAAQKEAPENPVPVQATLDGRTRGYHEALMQLRVTRQKAVVDSLYAIETSHVPFSDNVPIVYPNAEWWREMSARRIEKYRAMDLAKRGPAEKKIDDALKSASIPLDFVETPLSDVVDYLRDAAGIEVQLDKKALDDVGVSTDTAITMHVRGISLRSALRLMLRPYDLTYMTKDEVLLITTPEEANNRLVTRVYPVADLVLPVGSMMNNIMSGGMMGGMGMMGGGMDMMGGGMGGMGGGMGGMGGGMGGMGGGMGGMGGGMGFMGGGMGFMNVPNRRILPAGVVPPVPAGGFQAFAVPDDLTLSAKDVPPASVNKAVVKPDNKADGAEKPQAEIPPSGDPAVLDDYFAAHQPAPAALREAVRSRMSNRQYGQVVALIQAALRHGQVQPWMYEAMVLAMQAAERPDEEIERAVMSAVDFAQNSLDLMYLGIYLQRLGLQPRALQLFRQVSKLEPLRYEPYWYGLQSAQRLNDLDGIKWAVTGILSQAYAKKQAEIWQTAGRVANATLEKLRTEKRTAELKAFQAALDAAVQRDVVAIVHFTGEADIDILIEEPSGSVCSLRNPRTTGGGILLDRPASAAAGDSSEGDSEVYVCPKGFDGTYRMLVRRVWGTVTAGKVTVEVYTHCRSKDAAGLRKTIPLDKNGEALVVFELKNGRRTEPLQAEQVANAAASQLVVTQHILGQQLDAAASPSALQSLILSRQQQGGGLGGFPFFVGGVVGYQPVIETVPAGASLSVSAVVSADRRYVRVSALPNFQGIAAVHVFNMATGQDQNLANDNRIGNQGFSGTNFGGGR